MSSVMNSISTTRAVERCERLAALGPPPAWWRAFALRRWLRAYRAIMALDISVGAEMFRSLYPAVAIQALAARQSPSVAVKASDQARARATTADELALAAAQLNQRRPQ